MKLKILAFGIGTAPDYYTINDEAVTAYIGGQSETFDLSQFPEGATLASVTAMNEIRPILAATRINGELQVTLAQQVGAGHWLESEWMDASQYDPDTVHVVLDESRAFAGTPVVYTRQGAMTPEVTNG